MFNFSFAELLTLGVVALIVLGPEKLPQTMRKLGTYYAKFRRTITTIQTELESELDLAETRQQMQKELAKIKQAETDMQNEMAMMRSNLREFEKQQDTELSQSTPTNSTKETQDKSSANNNIDSANQDLDPHNNLDLQNHHNIQKITNANIDESADAMPTRPWKNMWFQLGEYDKNRRQPRPPFLPDYTPDPLLNTSTQSLVKYPDSQSSEKEVLEKTTSLNDALCSTDKHSQDNHTSQHNYKNKSSGVL